MIDEAAAANRLYPNHPSSSPAPSDAPRPAASAAEKLYGGPDAYVSPFDKKEEPAKPEATDSQAKPEQPKAEVKEEAKPETEKQGQDEQAITEMERGAVVAVAVDAGFDGEAPLTNEFAEVAAGLGPDGAAKLLDLQRRSTEEAWEKLSEDWKKEAQASPTFDMDVAAANQLLYDHAHPELMDFLRTYKAANHPAVIQFLGKVGRAMKAKR